MRLEKYVLLLLLLVAGYSLAAESANMPKNWHYDRTTSMPNSIAFKIFASHDEAHIRQIAAAIDIADEAVTVMLSDVKPLIVDAYAEDLRLKRNLMCNDAMLIATPDQKFLRAANAFAYINKAVFERYYVLTRVNLSEDSFTVFQNILNEIKRRTATWSVDVTDWNPDIVRQIMTDFCDKEVTS